MTLQQYIDQDMPFYHVTRMSCLNSILEQGLKAGQCKAVCVVRSCDEDVINEIINQIRPMTDSDTYALIKLTPSKHGITVNIVCEDSVEEHTAPLHNYILAELIIIDEDDIFRKNIKPDNGCFIEDESKILSLDGYTQPKRPKIDSDLSSLIEDY